MVGMSVAPVSVETEEVVKSDVLAIATFAFAELALELAAVDFVQPSPLAAAHAFA